MKEKGADPYDLKQQKNVLAESRMMIPDFHKRLKATLVDLKGALAELEESNEKEGPEIDDARNTIAEVEKWVEEKTGGRIPASTVASVSIELLRKGGPDAVCQHLYSLKKGSACVVNATSERDMAVFALEMIKAELMEKHFLCRTAASFVSSRIGIISRPPILPKDLGITRERNGSLIVVGSYVPKTTKQVSVEKLAMRPVEEREEEVSRAAEIADAYLKAHKDTLIMTSQNLITGKIASESLDINFKVSSALVEIVKRIITKPRYILAK
ncbi:hypothetical protein S83_059930, partial [Arachis hypogaea]